MKLHYYLETDSLYIELRTDTVSETREIASGLIADFGNDGNIIGLDVEQASASGLAAKIDEIVRRH